MASILVVDDSLLIRRALIKMLNAGNHDVIQSYGGSDALEKISKNKIDCVLLDLMMPGMDGFEVLQNLKKKRPHIPVIIVSSQNKEAIRNKCFELGAVDFLNKPPQENDLLHAIHKVIR